MLDSSIGIIQYIKSSQISISNEIANLNAGKDINIQIRDFFSNSPDYQKLQKQINDVQKQLQVETDMQKQSFLDDKLNNLRELQKTFKADVLRLAEIFSKMELRTERLKKAAALFEQGRFKDADAILKEEDLTNDQFNLILHVDYLELHKNNLLKKYKDLKDDEH